MEETSVVQQIVVYVSVNAAPKLTEIDVIAQLIANGVGPAAEVLDWVCGNEPNGEGKIPVTVTYHQE
jgi:hypothetical protein